MYLAQLFTKSMSQMITNQDTKEQDVALSNITSSQVGVVLQYTAEEEAAVVKKIDRVIIPVVFTA